MNIREHNRRHFTARMNRPERERVAPANVSKTKKKLDELQYEKELAKIEAEYE